MLVAGSISKLKDSQGTVFLNVKDHSVSKESFELIHNADLDMLITLPQPAADILGRYYESDDYISHTDSKRTLFEKVFQYFKEISLQRKVRLLASLKPKKGVLVDIGTGTGDFLVVSSKNGWQTIGTEPSEKASAIAAAKGVNIIAKTQTLEAHSIDIITMWHVLEHVADLEGQIVEIKRLLKPDGIALIAVPNYKSYDAKHYADKWAAYDVPRHLWHFSKTSIAKLFAVESMKLVEVLPMPFDAFYVSLLSEKYKTGKMNIFKAGYIGLISNFNALRSREFSSLIYVIKNT